MATLTLNAIEKVYQGGVKAIHGVDLEINDGEMLVLVGPSGCGKSTLLRMIAGLEKITAGSLLIDDAPMNDVEPGDRDIAMVFQNYALYPHMTVFNNMAYGLKNRNVPKDEIKQKVEEAANILELSHLLERKPKQLSGGQRQRVAMGRAIVRHPKVFLFDEPLSNLDAKLRVQMRLEIKKLQRAMSTTSVYVTHDQVEAMTLADRLVVLNGGRIEQIGTPLEVYNKPASVFVATFIGSPSMNIMPARLNGGMLDLGNGNRISTGKQYDYNDKVALGIRPEHWKLTTPGNGIEIEISMIEALGADQLLYCQLKGANTSQLVVRLEGQQEVAEGEKLHITVDADHIHLFDQQSKQRIEPETNAEILHVA